MEKGRGKRTDTSIPDEVFARKEYIEREAAIKRFTFATLDCLGMEPTIMAADVVKALKAIPAADVVPVVRCGECKHRDPEDKKCDCGGLEHAHMFPVADDWFCADGERKDGDGDV